MGLAPVEHPVRSDPPHPWPSTSVENPHRVHNVLCLEVWKSVPGRFPFTSHFDFWPLESRFSHEEKWEKGPNFLGPLLPILRLTFLESSCNLWKFGINKKDWCFFSITDPFRTHVPHFLLEQVVVNYTLVEEDILAGKIQGQGKLYPNVKVDPMIWWYSIKSNFLTSCHSLN